MTMIQPKQMLYLKSTMTLVYSVKRWERKCHPGLIKSHNSKMQHAVCPLVTLFHQKQPLTRACWWKTWHWAIITTAARGAAFGREKRLHLLLKCITFCWDTITLSAKRLLNKLQSKAKFMSYNAQQEQQAFSVMSAPKLQGHANAETSNRDRGKSLTNGSTCMTPW